MSRPLIDAIRAERRIVRALARRLSVASGGCCRVLTVDGGYWLRVGLFEKRDYWADGPHEFAAVYYHALGALAKAGAA